VIWVPAYGSSVTFRKNSLKYRGINAPKVTPIKVTADQLQQYTGIYYSEELETAYRFSIENGKLVAHHMRLGDFEFMPDMVVTDKFSSPNGTINFFKNDQKKIDGFRLTNGRIKNILFKRQG
jgi:hypothetical protein